MSMRCTGEKCKLGALTKDVTACTAHNCPDRTLPPSNADRIRAMSDEELVEAMCSLSALDVLVDFCQRKPECDAMLETKDGVPDELCKACLLEWLRKPAEEEKQWVNPAPRSC